MPAEGVSQIQAYAWLYWGVAAATVAETTAAAAAAAAAAAVVTAAAVTVAAAMVVNHRRNKRSNPLTAAVADGAPGAATAPATAAFRRLFHQCQANRPGADHT